MRSIAFYIRVFSFCLLPLGSEAQAEVYSWVDEQGNRHYTDKQSAAPQASSFKSESRINYLPTANSEKADDNPAQQQIQTLDILEAVNSAEEETEPADKDPSELTEAECQSIYGIECKRVVNWEKYALKQCREDDRDHCDDPEYLLRKYKPYPLADRIARANQMGARRNGQERKLMQFLERKYGDQCEANVKAYCAKASNSKACHQTLDLTCEDDRSLEQMLARYNDLTPSQKQKVLEMADEMAPTLDWHKAAKVLVDLIEIAAAAAY